MRKEFIDLSDHGNTLMAFDPIFTFNEVVYFGEKVLIKGRWLRKFLEIELRHFDRLLVVHLIFKIYIN